MVRVEERQLRDLADGGAVSAFRYDQLEVGRRVRRSEEREGCGHCDGCEYCSFHKACSCVLWQVCRNNTIKGLK